MRVTNKAYVTTPFLILSFVVLIVVYSWLSSSSHQNTLKINDLMLSVFNLHYEFLKQGMNRTNLASLLLVNSTVSSASFTELEQNVNNELSSFFSDHEGTQLEASEGTTLINSTFSSFQAVNKKVSVFQQKNALLKRVFWPYNALLEAGDDFDQDFVKNCVSGCEIETYEQDLEACLSELNQASEYYYWYLNTEEPFHDNGIDVIITVSFKNNEISREHAHIINNGTSFFFPC